MVNLCKYYPPQASPNAKSEHSWLYISLYCDCEPHCLISIHIRNNNEFHNGFTVKIFWNGPAQKIKIPMQNTILSLMLILVHYQNTI